MQHLFRPNDFGTTCYACRQNRMKYDIPERFVYAHKVGSFRCSEDGCCCTFTIFDTVSACNQCEEYFRAKRDQYLLDNPKDTFDYFDSIATTLFFPTFGRSIEIADECRSAHPNIREPAITAFTGYQSLPVGYTRAEDPGGPVKFYHVVNERQPTTIQAHSNAFNLAYLERQLLREEASHVGDETNGEVVVSNYIIDLSTDDAANWRIIRFEFEEDESDGEDLSEPKPPEL